MLDSLNSSRSDVVRKEGDEAERNSGETTIEKLLHYVVAIRLSLD